MIDWLIEQVVKIWAKFTTTWDNTWYWIVYKANNAYDRAVAWSKKTIDTLSSTVWNLYQAAKDHATDLLEDVTSTILYWYDRAKTAAEDLVKGVRDLANALYEDGLVWAKYWVDQAVAGAAVIVKGVIDSIIALGERVLVWLVDNYNRAVAAAEVIVQGVSDIWNALFAQAKVEFEELKVKVGIDEPVKQGTLLHFLQSPGSFILAYVWSLFLTFLEWSLAYAIGTVTDPLPPLPNWFEEGYGGVIIPGNGPPPGASGLAPPLDHIYVSGHSFRPGHPGIDLGLSMGAPVYAMHSGEILISGWSTIGYGFYITIKSDEWWTLYGHLEVLNVYPGQRVSQSECIGLGNSTGNSTGPHLHLEIKHRGTYIDPLTVL